MYLCTGKESKCIPVLSTNFRSIEQIMPGEKKWPRLQLSSACEWYLLGSRYPYEYFIIVRFFVSGLSRFHNFLAPQSTFLKYQTFFLKSFHPAG